MFESSSSDSIDLESKDKIEIKFVMSNSSSDLKKTGWFGNSEISKAKRPWEEQENKP